MPVKRFLSASSSASRKPRCWTRSGSARSGYRSVTGQPPVAEGRRHVLIERGAGLAHVLAERAEERRRWAHLVAVLQRERLGAHLVVAHADDELAVLRPHLD